MNAETKTTWLRRMGLGRMTAAEYSANLNGLNMFFGAVLGLALTGAEKLDAWQFGAVLCGLAGIVVSILYISSSRHRVTYAIFAVINAVIFPDVIDWAMRTHDVVPHQVRPTLLVWALMTILVEFWARHRDEPVAPNAD